MAAEKRQLTSEEKQVCEKAIVQLERRNKRIAPKIQYYDYMISKGLYLNYQEKHEEFLKIKRDINQELYENDFKILTLKGQISDGVEVNPNKKALCPQCGQEVKS